MDRNQTLIESNPIVAGIRDWATQNAWKLAEAYKMKGGWEGWAQVEIAISVTRQHGFNYGKIRTDTTREARVYEGTDKRSDILLATYEENRAYPKWTNMIELKCEGYYNKDRFVAAVEDDFKKLQSGKIKAEYGRCTGWVVAINVDPKVGKQLEAKLPDLSKLTAVKAEKGGPTKEEELELTIWFYSK